jgi:hypothetical protein
LSTTNPTWPWKISNPGGRSGKPANNRLSYDTTTAKETLQHWWNNSQGKRELEENLARYNMPTTNPTLAALGSNPWLEVGERQNTHWILISGGELNKFVTAAVCL